MVLYKLDEVPQLPLYHGIRTNKTSDQIKKEGFCTFGSEIDMKKEVILALKYFGKEKLSTIEKGKGYFVQSMLREVSDKFRRTIWASTNKNSACEWWARANPESISLLLSHIGIEPEKIDKYLSVRFGKNCYNIKLKMTSRGESANFNTGLECIPPNLIDSIEKCEDCKYTGETKKLHSL